MHFERWQQVNEIFTAVVELEPERRAAFLEQSCSGDQWLRSEVESLLAAEARVWNLIDRPALEVAAPLLADERSQLTPGEIIGRYEVISLIGRGGMGEVYLAVDKLLNRKIALKLLPLDYASNKKRLRRFEQEAQTASALNHPNILTIHEIGQVEDQPFIATEFVEGETLRQRLKRSPLTVAEALEVAIQIASALASAHQAGIVHRDIKPENVMLRPDGYVKVLDFGLAKLMEHDERTPRARVTEESDVSSGLMMGTVKYMSPEQAMGLQVDPRTDIFSLGVVLYEMATGRPPFRGKTARELIAAILNEEPPALSQFSEEAPEELQQIISGALRKDKEQRYSAIQDVLADLKSLKDNLDLQSKPVPAYKHRGSSTRFVASAIGRHKAGAAITTTLLLTAIVGVSYLGYKGFASRRTASSKNIELRLMTATGRSSETAISPDGRDIASFSGAGVLMREIETNSQMMIDLGVSGEHSGLTYSRDGNFLYYFADPTTDNDGTSLYQVPVLGGVPRKLMSRAWNSHPGNKVTFSPDGARLAFVRENDSGETALIVANVDGTDERELATRRSPISHFETAAWSPDGKRIVCTGGHKENKANHADLVEIGLEDGVERPIATQEFNYISDIAWIADGRSLLLIAQDRQDEPTQVWEIDYPTGIARRVSTDLDSYAGLSLTADSSVLVTVRTQATYNIWTQSADGGEAKQITSGPALKDGIAGIGWTPNGRIVFSSNANGRHDIWIMSADGGDRKQLTLNLGSDRSGLSVSPDGRYVVFVSKQSGTNNIWRVSTDGSDPKQLTNGSGELNPFFSADGQWVTYRVRESGNLLSWKLPVDGGEPMKATDDYLIAAQQSQTAIAVSPDGNLVAYHIGPGDQTGMQRIEVASTSGRGAIRTFDLRIGPTGLQHLRWRPDGGALTYIDNRGAAPNIWNQPLDGSPPQQLTDFKSDAIWNFDWSRDGRLLAIVRRSGSSDVVLMKNFR
jgi:serine/threonine protein kinase